MAPAQEVDSRKYNGSEKGIANAARAETGQIDQAIGEPISSIEKIDKQRPSIKPQEPVSDCKVKGRGDGFREKTGNAVRFGAIKGKKVIEVVQDYPGIIQRADEQKEPEESNVLPLPPDLTPGA